MINGQTKIFGILGRPVAHSLSPVMHNAAFRHLGINAAYVAFPVTDFRKAVSGLRGLGICGVSVTIPFKEEIIPLIDELDPQAATIGAVNTVVNRDGRLTGYNTDWLGAVTALTAKVSLKSRHVLILGAGGASRAIAYGIIQAGGRVSLTDIDAARAAALVHDLGAQAIPPEALETCDATILVNATPVGMTPDVDGIPIDPDLLGRFGVVMDIVYQPLQTRLLREAEAHGCATIDGLQMLIHQATAQFELWTGKEAPAEVMARAAYQALGANL
ncbi:MAG: shikimate dehydrogenase [Proteobacteria bacterium]|nr:shikimate dehydrogenase [Pseudomonadota bacterium]MBU4355152.1 shikimate dehydrogenase [Pseudomonadota bacterium]MBU4447719.1 shikimate dehydrogenase [Pseudomonadota bacterium]